MPISAARRKMPAAQNGAAPLQVTLAFPGGFEFGGIGRMMLYVTEAWRRTAAPVAPTMLDPRGSGALRTMPFHLTMAIVRLVRARVAGRIDLLHLNVAGRGSTLRKVVLSELAGLLSLPTVVHLHDYDYGVDLARRSRFGRRWVRRMFRRARLVLVLGERDRRTVTAEMGGMSAARVVVLPNAVPDTSASAPGRRQEASRGCINIVFVGSLDSRKGLSDLLRALAAPELRRRAWRLHVVGRGDTPRFVRQASELALENRVVFHGWLPRDAVAALYRDADVFALPSHAEGLAMALLEAMAHGLAIVATPVGAHLEAVTAEKEALLAPPGDVDALRRAMTRLMVDAELRRRLSRAARERYRESFAIDRYATRLLRLYAAALAWPMDERGMERAEYGPARP